jgi:hypothetical protein
MAGRRSRRPLASRLRVRAACRVSSRPCADGVVPLRVCVCLQLTQLRYQLSVASADAEDAAEKLTLARQQEAALKEEIRRLQRNDVRDTVNMEYLKNIVVGDHGMASHCTSWAWRCASLAQHDAQPSPRGGGGGEWGRYMCVRCMYASCDVYDPPPPPTHCQPPLPCPPASP